MESTAAVRLPGPLTTYCHRHSDVDLKLRTSNPRQLATALLEGEIEAALAAEPIAEARFDWAPAFDESLALVAPSDHPTIDDATPPPDTVIVFEHGCPHRRQLDAWHARRGDLPRQTIELGSYHAMFGSVVAGMGVALMPKSVLAAFPKRGRVSTHPLPEDLQTLRTVLIWPRGASSPKIDALIDILGADNDQRRESASASGLGGKIGNA